MKATVEFYRRLGLTIDADGTERRTQVLAAERTAEGVNGGSALKRLVKPTGR